MLEVEVVNFSITAMGYAIVLKNKRKEKIIPIFIGPSELNAIANAVDGVRTDRPLTHDLTKILLTEMGARVQKVYINKFQNGVFFSQLYLEQIHKGGEAETFEIDSRPSDAIALALRFSASIYVSNKVYEATSVDAGEFANTTAENIFALDEIDKESFFEAMLEHLHEGIEDMKPAPARSKLQVLRQKLDLAVQKEDYEEAARIRDELASIMRED